MKKADVNQDDLLPLIDLIYQAGTEPAQWRAVLERIIARHHGSAVLFIQDTRTNNAGFVECMGHDPVFMRSYAGHFAAINPMKDKWAAAPEGAIIESHKALDRAAFDRSEFYNDFFRPMDAYHGIGSVILKTGTVVTNFSMQRAARYGIHDEAEIGRLRVLTTHMKRSIQISRALTAAHWARDAATTPASGPDSGFVFTDADGRILFADPMGETILRADDGLGVTNGRLRAAESTSTARLLAMIHAAARTAAGKGARSGGVLGLPRRREGPPLALLVSPWQGNPVDYGIPGPAVLIIVEGPRRAPQPGAAGAAMLYGLTAAETRLLEALLTGRRLAEHAADARISLATAKTHLQAVFAKTGQRRQTDLVRAVLSSPIARHQAGFKD